MTETTGIFFEEQTEEALSHAVEEMEQRHLDFKPEDLKKNISQFSQERTKMRCSKPSIMPIHPGIFKVLDIFC